METVDNNKTAGGEMIDLVQTAARHTDHLCSLLVKAEYVCDNRPLSLGELCSPPKESSSETNSKNGRTSKSKKRPRDARINDNDKVCLAVVRGETCPYGATCRFSHDLKGYMAQRPEDITALEGLKVCPHYEVYGACPYALMCRWGRSHIHMATGENLRKNPLPDPLPAHVINNLTKELQTQLRKNTYPFVCKRHNEKKKSDASSVASPNGNPNVGTEAPNSGIDLNEKIAPSNGFSPFPCKSRKIIDFSNKVYVAPLTTVGNLPFRRIMKKFGADITCGEMALATNILSGKPSEWALLKRHPDEDVFGIQLAAGYPDVWTRAAELVEKHVSVDFLDMNLGCPLDRVCDNGSGAALMMREKRLHESLQGISAALIKCPLTIKMRTGWDEKKPFAHELVAKIQSWGIPSITAVMVHGRSRLQRYSKEADWDYVRKIVASQDESKPVIPIIGNGDIMSYTDYEEKVEKSEGLVSCAMLARGALIKPWLPTEIKERRHWDISATERLDILKDFVRFGLLHWGSDQQGVNNCRRFLLEWLSFLHRYVPVAFLEQPGPQKMNQRPPKFMCGRSDLETLLMSDQSSDWIKISEMLLGPVPDGFRFEPKHKANSYRSE
jgi:tRNA-dihydrouridine synthase 3